MTAWGPCKLILVFLYLITENVLFLLGSWTLIFQMLILKFLIVEYLVLMAYVGLGMTFRLQKCPVAILWPLQGS